MNAHQPPFRRLAGAAHPRRGPVLRRRGDRRAGGRGRRGHLHGHRAGATGDPVPHGPDAHRRAGSPAGARPSSSPTPKIGARRRPASRSYFLLPLEFVPPLLAAGLGYDPRGLGARPPARRERFSGPPAARWSSAAKRRVSRCAPGASPTRRGAATMPGSKAPSACRGRRRPPAGLRRPSRSPDRSTSTAHGPIAPVGNHEVFARRAARREFYRPAGYRMDLERLLSATPARRK